VSVKLQRELSILILIYLIIGIIGTGCTVYIGAFSENDRASKCDMNDSSSLHVPLTGY
jgi:hypothetical protein